MTIQHSKLRTTKTGHVFTFGNAEEARFTTLALHGYGQLADHLLKKFESFSSKEHFIISPEGLNRFYWKGVSEQPVASWMTSLDRQDEIADYIEFLDRVNQNYGWSKKNDRLRLLFGFSQGCASLWRWILNSKPDFDILVLWAGWLPEDMRYGPHLEYLKKKKIYFIHGSHDQYLTSERFRILQQRFENENIPINYLSFEGTHQIPRHTLKKIFSSIISESV
jgi:predicted esterase